MRQYMLRQLVSEMLHERLPSPNLGEQGGSEGTGPVQPPESTQTWLEGLDRWSVTEQISNIEAAMANGAAWAALIAALDELDKLQCSKLADVSVQAHVSKGF